MSTGTPARPPASGRPDVSTILSNLGNLLAMDQAGKLTQLQVAQLRQLIHGQTRHITLQTLLKNQPNPLLTLPSHLDPSVPCNNNPPLTTKDQFRANISNATGEAQRILANLLSATKVKELLQMKVEDRNQLLASDLPLKNKFSVSVTFYTKGAQGFLSQPPIRTIPSTSASGSSSGTSTPQPRPNAPTTGAHVARPPSTGAGISTPAQSSIGRPPDNQTRLAPAHTFEPEAQRRKRKFGQWLGQVGPGMEYELGVNDVLSELLDTFVREGGRGAAKLARHRESDHVGVKDMAYFLDRTYGITVPGFNVQVSDRVHAAPEGERKKGRAVAPRAARLGRGTARDEE